MVEYLVMHLRKKYKIATLSRGYKRKTRGYALAGAESTAIDIGDEPMQFHRKFPDLPVAVGEERIYAIPQLLHDKPQTEVIILDDAFQHRAIQAGLNILLTECSNLFTRDFFLPTGDLRDLRSSAKRAQIIIVSKSDPNLSRQEKTNIIQEINPASHQRIFFSSIFYGTPYHMTQHDFYFIDDRTEVLLVTGIANPKPLKNYLEERLNTYHMMHFNDHHIFSFDDWKDILKRFDAIDTTRKIILTTEKDAMRLLKYEQQIKDMPFYIMPIEHRFLFNEEHDFNDIVVKFISDFKKPC
ncbi:MAG: tetraacyldisaccharide 4'-kinase [Flavisolibacter sp.]